MEEQQEFLRGRVAGIEGLKHSPDYSWGHAHMHYY